MEDTLCSVGAKRGPGASRYRLETPTRASAIFREFIFNSPRRPCAGDPLTR